MKRSGGIRSMNPAVVIAAVIIAVVMLILLFILVLALVPAPEQVTLPGQIAVIPAPTATPTIDPSMLWTPTPIPPTPVPVIDGISVGSYVQISGTGGDGLRVRSNPGTDQETLFVAAEAEVFLVQQGPQYQGDHTWWYLVAPYDAARAGWAVTDFLTVISTQTP